MKFIITERQYRLLNEDIKPDCSKFKWDPKKKIYDNENDYNCALLFWEDALNLNKAYLYQQKNVIQTSTSDRLLRIPNIKDFYWENRFGGDQWDSYSEYVKDVAPFNVKIVNYYKSLKFNFPTYIGLWTSPDIFHKFIRPNGIYFDGHAYSPIFNHPGNKPTLKLPEPIKPDPIKPEPIDPVVDPIIPPVKKPEEVKTEFTMVNRCVNDLQKFNIKYFPDFKSWNDEYNRLKNINHRQVDKVQWNAAESFGQFTYYSEDPC
jgi:hypothetical protein